MAGRRTKRAVSPPVDPPILVASGVGKAIDGNVLLRPVDVSVAPGRCVVLRGENGSGKTTLLRILAGTMNPSEGARRWTAPRPTSATRRCARTSPP